MIRRLVDAHYYQNRDEPTEARVRFWLRESRTPCYPTLSKVRWVDYLLLAASAPRLHRPFRRMSTSTH